MFARQDKIFFIVILLLIIFSLFRFLVLGSDPPAQFSLGFISDEGWWVHNARNAALFGEWIKDEFNQGVIISPLFSLITYISFSILGCSYVSARLVSGLAGIGVILLVFFWQKSERNKSTLLVKITSTVFIGLQFFFLTFNRVALVDSLLVLFLFSSVFVWDKWDKNSNLTGIISGLLLFGAMLVKPFAVFMYFLFILLWLWEYKKGLFVGKRVILFIITTIISIGIWFWFMFPDYLSQFISLNLRFSHDNLPTSPLAAFRGVVSFFITSENSSLRLTRFINQSPILSIVIFLLTVRSLIIILNGGIKKFTALIFQLNRRQIINVLWLIIGVIFLLPNHYKPERRFLFLIPPMVMIIGDKFGNYLVTERKILISNMFFPLIKSTTSKILASFIYISFPSLFLSVEIFHFFQRVYSGTSEKLIFLIAFLLACIFSTSIFFIVIRLWKSKIKLKRISILLVVFFISFHTFLIGKWLHNLNWSMEEASTMLGQHFTSKTVVMGSVSDTLCLNNKAFTFVCFDSGGGISYNSHPLKKFHPDYLLTIKSAGGVVFPQSEILSYKRLLIPIREIPILPDNNGKPRVIISWFKIKKLK